MTSLSVNTVLDYPAINNAIDNNLHLMVTLTAPVVEISDETRPPLDICVALDVSGSMRGGRMEIMKSAAIKFVDNLSPKDRISIITFSTNVNKLTDEPVYATRENREELKKKINTLQSLSSTNMSDTLDMMFELLSGKSDNKRTIKRGIFFTDGNATIAIRDYAGLVNIVKNRNSDISISAFGFGEDHDSELLDAFAKIGKGNNFYVQELEECAEYFGLELGGLLTTFAKDIVVKLKPCRGVTINKVLNNFHVKVIKDENEEDVTQVPERIQVLLNDFQGDEVVVSVDNIYGEESRNVVIELEVTNQLPTNDLVEVSVLYNKVCYLYTLNIVFYVHLFYILII